ncbi:VOC family protein [Bacillus sp. FJAT-42376]|uniref:VOC family protein n=1 Tax=Bacillus sp. FJAT-42376 TaxID=2014076 RepID=UPI000F4F46C9|nr:VOC family protein [Bacillus sp. FJAT-42376]AZB44473.1 VOC family protein [Bacillus sp. FJAT-42376]
MKLDHVVHFVKQPAKEAGAAFQMLGFHTVAGGSHENWGTANSLCYFGLDYIEFLAIEDEEKAGNSDNPLIRLCMDMKQEGLVQLAIHTEEMDDVAEKLKASGLTVKKPFAGSRKRSDGSVLSWRMLFAEHPDSEFPLPFFIEWGSPDEERKEDLIRTGALAPHPNEVKGITEVVYLSDNPSREAAHWAKWLGLEEPVFAGKGAKIPLGNQTLAFVPAKDGLRTGIHAVSFCEKHQKEPREKHWMGGTYIL